MEVKSIYELIGGEETMAKLIDAFYTRVAAHPRLSLLFPDDMMPVRNKQFKFLTQFFGGPPLYSEVYGAPMMRDKHLPHAVSPMRAKEWLECMSAALDEVGLHGEVRDFIFARLSMVAHHMINTADPEPTV